MSEQDGHRIDLCLAYGGRTLGRLSVARDVPFSGEEQMALDLLARHLSSDLEIARVQAIDARDRLRLSLLERVASRLRNVRDLASARGALAEVGDALVPDFADLCMVYLVQNGQLSLLCMRHREVDQQQLLAARLASPVAERAIARSLSELAMSRQPQQLRRGAATAGGALSPPFDELMQTLQSETLIAAPMWARGKPIGVMCFGQQSSADTGRLSTALTWAQEISERCASAFDCGALVEELREAILSRDNLMAMVAHDLKGPLSAISLSAMSMIPEEAQLERRSSHKQLKLIRRAAEHMHHMVNDLLSASALEARPFGVEPVRVSAYELVEDACQLAEPLLRARSLHLERKFTEELPVVFADREAIERVFANLLGNAAKFTPQGGRVRVSASGGDGRVVVFRVSDTGPGIPEEQQARVFECYWKAHKRSGGLGLGLYIAKAIVEAHGGRIWLETDAGGATFCFELPCCEPVAR